MKSHITGIMVYYYMVCRRKLWYFTHDILMEYISEDVAIGKLLDENSYMRTEKHINIDNTISIDFIQEKNMLHEIKKSRKIEEASILQIKYYLYYLKKRGVNGMRGRIDFPLLKQSVDVEITDDDIQIIDNICIEIKEIIDNPVPCRIEKKGICRNCAYYDLCFL